MIRASPALRPRRRDEVAFLQGECLRRTRRAPHPAGQADHRHDVPYRRLEEGDDRQDEEEGREAEHHVDDPHQDRRPPTRRRSPTEADEQPQRGGDPTATNPNLQGDARAVEPPGRGRPVEVVRPEGMRHRGGTQDVHDIDPVRLVRGEEARERGNEEEEEDDRAAPRREPVPEEPPREVAPDARGFRSSLADPRIGEGVPHVREQVAEEGEERADRQDPMIRG